MSYSVNHLRVRLCEEVYGLGLAVLDLTQLLTDE